METNRRQYKTRDRGGEGVKAIKATLIGWGA